MGDTLRKIHAAASAAPGSPCVAAITLPKCALFNSHQENLRGVVNAGIRELSKQPAARPRFLVDLEPVDVELAVDKVHYYGKGYIEFAQLAMEAMRKLWAPHE